jgi:hypothetical protein
MLGDAEPGLPDPWVEAEIADQLLRAREATDVADRRDQACCYRDVHPGDGEQRRTAGSSTVASAISRSSQARSSPRRSNLRRCRSIAARSSAGRTWPASQTQPGPLNRLACGQRGTRCAARIARVSFFRRAGRSGCGAPPDGADAPSRHPAARPQAGSWQHAVTRGPRRLNTEIKRRADAVGILSRRAPRDSSLQHSPSAAASPHRARRRTFAKSWSHTGPKRYNPPRLCALQTVLERMSLAPGAVR